MEYITYDNRIAAVDNGEEVGEVTFAESKGTYTINHTYVDDRLRGQGIAAEGLWRRLKTEAAGWRRRAAMLCCGWHGIADEILRTHRLLVP